MIIIAERKNQLGNRLIVFSHFIAFAQKYNVRIVNLAFEDYAPLFERTRDDLFCSYPHVRPRLKVDSQRRLWLLHTAQRVMRKAEKKRFPFLRVYRIAHDQMLDLNTDFAKVARRNVVFIDGYFFRKLDGISESASSLREYFQPTETARKNVQQIVQAARGAGELLVGVHMRQGDYRTYKGGLYFYTSAQYAMLMAKTAALFAPSHITFLLCSNEPQEAEMFSEFSVTFGSGDLVEDMYALAKCDYLIGPPSTFTYWASFYGNVPLCRITASDAEFTRKDFCLALDEGWVF